MSRMRVVDSHCHLDFEGMEENLPGILARAEEAGVGLMLSISSRVATLPEPAAHRRKNANVFCTVGTHPHNAHEEPDVTADDLVKLTQHPKVVGIGEVGLDYHYDLAARGTDEGVPHPHRRRPRDRPAARHPHPRGGGRYGPRAGRGNGAGAFKALLHCFTSQDWLAQKGVALGLTVSFSGILTYKTAENLRATARALPEDRILVETDAPYLAPVPHRGKPNEPAFVVKTLEHLAAARGTDAPRMARITSDNFFRLFDKVPRPEAYA
jgi:TatD DNase family protein